MPAPVRAFLRGIRGALGTLAARLYLIAFALIFGWALVSSRDDESMAAVIPLFATVPSSVVLLFTLPETDWTFVASILLGAVFNALIIGWCARVLRRGNRPDTTA